MKRYLLLFIYLIAQVAIAQNVKVNQDVCKHCNMLVKDRSFAALAITGNQSLTFDAIECLVNYLKTNDETAFTQLLVADYTQNNQWLEAKDAFYLKSSAIPSPMGAYLSAYPDLKTAQKIQKQKGGEVFTWAALKKKFVDSRFGALNHPDHHHRGDAYASIGIMGDHLHHQGGWMFSFRAMHMQMSGNQKGTSSVTDKVIYQEYHAVPQQMLMNMYMLGAMYAPTDHLTLAVMQSMTIQRMEMHTMHQHNMNVSSGMHMSEMSYHTESFGLGDVKLSLLYSLIGQTRTSLHLNAGVSLPTGSYHQTDDTPMSDNMRLPYSMQLGSGTLDCSVGATYKLAFDKSNLGIQPMATFRTGQNDSGYRLGNLYRLNSWLSHAPNNWLGLVGRAELTLQQEIISMDLEMNPQMAPASNIFNSGFYQMNLYAGVNLSLPVETGVLKKLKLGVEIGAPIYRNVRGIQMKEQLTINSGIRYML